MNRDEKQQQNKHLQSPLALLHNQHSCTDGRRRRSNSSRFMLSSQRSLRSIELTAPAPATTTTTVIEDGEGKEEEKMIIMGDSSDHFSSTEYSSSSLFLTNNNNSDSNHPVLARMMRALKRQQQQPSTNTRNRTTQSEEFYLTATRPSFASFNNNNNNNKQIFGRQNELDQLFQAFDNLVTSHLTDDDKSSTPHHSSASFLPSCRRQLALVHGTSGCGKSILIHVFRQQLLSLYNNKNKNDEDCDDDVAVVWFASGKVDQLQTTHAVPYAALIKMIRNLVQQALLHCPIHTQQVKERLETELSPPDAALLATLVPELSPILQQQQPPVQQPPVQQQHDENENDVEDHDKNEDDNERTTHHYSRTRKQSYIATTAKAFTRFKLLLRAFFRCIATGNTPVVLFLDDIQWADEATLEVLEALLTDRQSNHLMIILAYRDDDDDDDDIKQRLEKYFTFHPSSTTTANNQQQSSSSPLQKTPPSPFTSHNNAIHTLDIKVSNLNGQALNELVAAALHMDPTPRTEELADIVMNKTRGNPFYALNFLDMLYNNGMLRHTGTTTTTTTNDNYNDTQIVPVSSSTTGNEWWEWSNSTILLQQTNVADNLAKILEAKVLRLPEKVRSILQLAAFIGHDFDSNILTTIVHEEQDMIRSFDGEYSFFDLFEKDVIQEWIVDALDLALGEGLLEVSTRDGMYKFSHDRIQHCLYRDLMPDDVERRLLHQRIGKLLWNTISSPLPSNNNNRASVDDWILFLAADNLNRGPQFIDNESDRVQMIEINLRAAFLASSKAAFLVAAEYLRSGAKLLSKHRHNRSGNNSRDDDDFVHANHDLCMDLFCTAAEIECIVCDFDRTDEMAQRIHKYARVPQDHFPAHLAEIKALAMQGQLGNAMTLAFRVLKQLGVFFPKRITILTVVWEWIRANHLVGKRQPNELLVKLPSLTDGKTLFALELLSAISGYAYMAGDAAKFTFVAVGLRMARLTLQHGLSDLYAPQAFVGYGTMCCFFGNFELGLSFGQAAQTLFDRFLEAGTFEGRTQLHYFSCIYTWTFGIDSTMIESLVQMYHKAMLAGDIDFAYLGTTTLLFCGLNAGLPLDELVTKGTRFRLEMEEYGLKTVWFYHLPPLQMLRIMLGSDESNVNPAILEGQDIDLEEFTEQVMQTNSATSVYGMIVCELILAVYFGDWERVQAKVDHALKYIDASEGYFTYPISIFLVVWCCFRLYDVTGRTSYRRNGYRYYRKSKKFVKQGSPMAAALHVALAAAKSMFVKRRSPRECEQEFVSALKQLENGKYYWIQSSVADGLAEAFVKAGNHAKGEEYWRASLEPCMRWGAQEKIKYLNEKLTGLRIKNYANL